MVCQFLFYYPQRSSSCNNIDIKYNYQSKGRVPKKLLGFWSFVKRGGKRGGSKNLNKNTFLKKYFFKNYLEPVEDLKNMFYTWSGVFLAYL